MAQTRPATIRKAPRMATRYAREVRSFASPFINSLPSQKKQQAPSPKLQRNSKHQIPMRRSVARCCLVLGASLELEAWCLVLSSDSSSRLWWGVAQIVGLIEFAAGNLGGDGMEKAHGFDKAGVLDGVWRMVGVFGQENR